MKILIENTVPFNNGDAALIFSIGDKFKERGVEVYYSSPNKEKIKANYPEENWIESFLSSRIIKVPLLGFLIILCKILFNKQYREFDAVISAPGGYINSYYSFKRRLQIMMLYKVLLKKKVYMYSQSIGPFTEKGEKIFTRYIKYFDLFYVRDDVSKKRLDDFGEFTNVVQTKDAAFLLENIMKDNKLKKEIAVSVREWKFDNRKEDIYFTLIQNIINVCVENGYKIVFLSTCQGEPSYRDDSLVAERIYKSLPVELQKHAVVDKSHYKIQELRKELTKFDFVIGTRLHMCILSWLSGTPAFNISYEEKGKECYQYLDIDRYSVDYNFSGDVKPLIDNFIKDKKMDKVFKRVDEVHVEAVKQFNEMFEDIYNNQI